MKAEEKLVYAQVLKGHLDTLLLATLRAGPAHGYVIIERLRLQSLATLDLPEGAIYPALHRLEQAGLLTSKWSEESARRRQVYALLFLVLSSLFHYPQISGTPLILALQGLLCCAIVSLYGWVGIHDTAFPEPLDMVGPWLGKRVCMTFGILHPSRKD